MRLILGTVLLAFTLFFNSVELSSLYDPPGSPPPPEISTGSSPYVSENNQRRGYSGNVGNRAAAPIVPGGGRPRPQLDRLNSRRSINSYVLDPQNVINQAGTPRSGRHGFAGSHSINAPVRSESKSPSSVPHPYASVMPSPSEGDSNQYFNPHEVGAPQNFARSPTRDSQSMSMCSNSPTRSSSSSSSNELHAQHSSADSLRSGAGSNHW